MASRADPPPANRCIECNRPSHLMLCWDCYSGTGDAKAKQVGGLLTSHSHNGVKIYKSTIAPSKKVPS